MHGVRAHFSRSVSVDLRREIVEHASLRSKLRNALLSVLMNVDHFSRVIQFDRDLSADSDIPEHTVLGSEGKTLLPSRRR